jgi:hypothetical protein
MLVAVAAIAVLVYTFWGSTAQGTEFEIKIDFWGLLAFLAVLVIGIRWARRGADTGGS